MSRELKGITCRRRETESERAHMTENRPEARRASHEQVEVGLTRQGRTEEVAVAIASPDLWEGVKG